jgi:large subunit ribosomal protein L17
MKKRIAFRKLGRTTSHRWAMLNNMVTSLIEHERIVTTTPKAKEVQRLAEKLVTYAKKPDKLHGRRLSNVHVKTSHAQTKLMNVLGPRYAYREGGYTRVMKLAVPRLGDKADMSVIEYVDRPGEIRAARPPSAFQNVYRSHVASVSSSSSSASSTAAATAHLEEVFRRLGISHPGQVLLDDDENDSDGTAIDRKQPGSGERKEDASELEDLPPFPTSTPDGKDK